MGFMLFKKDQGPYTTTLQRGLRGGVIITGCHPSSCGCGQGSYDQLVETSFNGNQNALKGHSAIIYVDSQLQPS